jgi:hypothetical protein
LQPFCGAGGGGVGGSTVTCRDKAAQGRLDSTAFPPDAAIV